MCVKVKISGSWELKPISNSAAATVNITHPRLQLVVIHRNPGRKSMVYYINFYSSVNQVFTISSGVILWTAH
jgi:hypothetical protein